jgi:calcineurin-like phosphoesterase family protein
MSRNFFFISDTHFFHANILKFVDDKGHRIRAPFQSLDEMHEYMVEKWNSVVQDGDYVYHLGDVTFQYHGKFSTLMRRLKGSKRLIVGNHDRIWNPALQANFAKSYLWKGFHEHGFTCSHIPLRLDSLRDGAFNVHGHIHEKTMDDPHYINVSVEVRDYTPVHLDTILAEIKKVQNAN